MKALVKRGLSKSLGLGLTNSSNGLHRPTSINECARPSSCPIKQEKINFVRLLKLYLIRTDKVAALYLNALKLVATVAKPDFRVLNNLTDFGTPITEN